MQLQSRQPQWAAAAPLSAAAALVAALVAVLAPGTALAQLPNLRVGLPPDNDAARQINRQEGYDVRGRDVPFGERFKATLKYYDSLPDQPLYYRDRSPLDVACCYPFNAYWTANAAIHPHWFKEFGLDRWCRQDVCISVWTEDHEHDLMWKVTDVCDPKDCPSPFDIKVEPYKGRYLWYGNRGSKPPGPAFAYFVKCWADGLAQPDLVSRLPGPALANSRHWMIKTTTEQHANNQQWNRNNGRREVPLGILRRPEATQYAPPPDYRASDYPPGSASRVPRPSWCSSSGGGGGGGGGGTQAEKGKVAAPASKSG